MTICFADLDGADGLWVPEERTVLVNRRLSEREVAEVIEHELGHVAIDDQHADLDAGVRRPPPASSRRWAAALTAAACLAIVGGVSAGLARDPGSTIKEGPVVAPSAPPLTAAPPGPQVTTTRVMGPDGRLQVRTVTLTATPTATTPAVTTAGSVAPSGTRRATLPVPPPSPTTPAATTTQAPDTGTPTTEAPTPTTVPPTSEPADETGGELADEVGETGATGDGGSGSAAPFGTP